MTSPITDSCALGLTDERLSAWRDGFLSTSDMQRIAEHVPTCPACQQRIGDFERIGQALLGQRVPHMQARVWRGLRNAIEADIQRGRAKRMKLTASRGLATLAAVLLIALFAALLYGRVGRPFLPGSGTPVVNLTLTPAVGTATATTTTVLGGGWRAVDTVGNQGFPVMAFAPSQPVRGYACNTQPVNNYNFVVSVTSDAGETWHTATPPGIGGDRCLVSVNPSDAQDVVVVHNQTQTGIVLARSRDGGITWTRPDVGTLAFDTLGWVGSSLFVATQVTENPVNSEVNLYMSVKGQPFVRLDHNGTVSGITLESPRFITGLGSTVFVQWGQPVQPIFEHTIVSHDNGQTWAPITFHDGSQLVHPFNATPTVTGDALVMVGVYDSANNQTVISRDAGATWQKLPAASSSVPYYQYLGVTPDGTVFTVSSTLYQQDNPDRNLYEANVGDSKWRVASVLPVSAVPVTVAWNANGHPTNFWASMGYLIVHTL